MTSSVSLLLTFNNFQTFFYCFYCWLWTGKVSLEKHVHGDYYSIFVVDFKQEFGNVIRLSFQSGYAKLRETLT